MHATAIKGTDAVERSSASAAPSIAMVADPTDCPQQSRTMSDSRTAEATSTQGEPRPEAIAEYAPNLGAIVSREGDRAADCGGLSDPAVENVRPAACEDGKGGRGREAARWAGSALGEEWRPVVGWEGLYEVSSLGRVRSLDRTLCRTNGRDLTIRGRLLHPWVTGKGYLVVDLNRQTIKVHRLVLQAFRGPADGRLARHLNGNPADNRLENLSWGSHEENVADSRRHGTLPIGERVWTSKLTTAKVLEIRQRAAAGESQRRIADSLGVSKTTITDTVAGRRWRHVADLAPSDAPRDSEQDRPLREVAPPRSTR